MFAIIVYIFLRTICSNTPGSYDCACIDGYIKSGKGADNMSFL